MTQKEYMEALEEKLERFNFSLQQEILDDYEQHFFEGRSAGKSEEEIIRELGDIDDMIQEFSEEERGQELMQLDAVPAKTETYDCGYRAIKVEGRIADVTLENSPDGKLHVEYQNHGNEAMQERYRFYQYEEKDVFCVGVKDLGTDSGKAVKLFGMKIFSGNNEFFENGTICLKLQIPSNFPKVSVSTVSGGICLSGINVQELFLQTASGDVKLEHARCDSLKTQTISGNMQVEEISGRQIHGQTVSGDLEWENSSADDFCLETISGDIQLENSECGKLAVVTVSGDVRTVNVSGNTQSARTTSGDMEISADFEAFYLISISGDLELCTGGRAREVCGTTTGGDIHMNLEAVSGVEVAAQTRSGDCNVCNSNGSIFRADRGRCSIGHGDCKLKVKSGSGDISVRIQV